MICWKHNIIFVFLALSLSPGLLHATSPPAFVKAQLQQQDKNWPGQRQTLSVTLYTTTSFSGSTRFELPKVSGMLIMESEDRPLLGTEKIDGVSYIFKQHEIDLFPQRVGRLTVPPFAVEFSFRGVDNEVVEQRFSTNELLLTVLEIPAVDPKRPVIVTPNLSVEDHWKPEPTKAKVGDAFTRTITMTAEDLPGMAFPPFHVQEIEGLGLYSRQPQVADEMQRGEFIGKRVEKISYVCEREGTFIIAEASIQWWNPEKELLQDVVLKAVKLKVAVNPLLQQESPEEEKVTTATESSWRWSPPVLFLSVLLIAGCIWRYLRAGRQRGQVKDLEKELFNTFRKASASHDGASTMQTLLHWLDCSGLSGKPANLTRFIELAGDEKLALEIKALEAELYANGQKQKWSGEKLYDSVEQARKILKQRKACSSHYSLPNLNP